MIAQWLPDAEVLDLFAGSGAMGLEALSRGAARCTFVEADRRNMKVLQDNIRNCEAEGSSRVIGGDYASAIDRIAGDRGKPVFDVVILDPPYDRVEYYGTALDLWGMTDRIPHSFDVTVPSGTNMSRIRKDLPDLRVHYVRKVLHEIGAAETVTPLGSKVRLYDKERCICDLIRSRKNMDMQLYSGAIREYFSDHPNMRKLLKYGKQFGIEDKIRTYSEVLA